IDMAALLEPTPAVVGFSPSVYPHVDFDLSYLVDSDLPAGTLLEATTGAAGSLLESARVFDVFTGARAGKKAIAIRYRLRAPDRTMTAEGIASVRQTLIATASTLGAELRGA